MEDARSTRTNSRRNKPSPMAALAMELNKVPPHDRPTEEAVLGALMLERDALNTIIDILKVDHFYFEEHRKIYESIVQLFGKSAPVDLITVSEQLRLMGALELVGGLVALAKLTSKVSSAANIEYHARLVVEKAIKRELISISGEVNRDSFDPSTDVFEVLDLAEQKLFDVSEQHIRKNYSSMTEVVRTAMQEITARRDHDDEVTGVPTGFTALDRITSGWQPSDLVIIAARPAMGKTAFILSCARNAAVHFQKPVAVFSLEMSATQLVNRILSSEAEIEGEKLRRGNLNDNEWKALTAKSAFLSNAPLFIDDTPALSILELRAKCRRLKAQHDIKLIVIDYLQLMTGDVRTGGNREQEIASISRALKNLAKELNVPVIALSQLSRAVETRTGGKKPQLSDLRESGSIEQDADMVIFLYRPEYYDITTDENGNDVRGQGEIIISKHRNGSLGSVYLRFIGKYTKFANLEDGSFGGFAGGGFNAALPPTDRAIPSEFDSPMPTITLGSKINRQSELPPSDELGEVPF